MLLMLFNLHHDVPTATAAHCHPRRCVPQASIAWRMMRRQLGYAIGVVAFCATVNATQCNPFSFSIMARNSTSSTMMHPSSMPQLTQQLFYQYSTFRQPPPWPPPLPWPPPPQLLPSHGVDLSLLADARRYCPKTLSFMSMWRYCLHHHHTFGIGHSHWLIQRRPVLYFYFSGKPMPPVCYRDQFFCSVLVHGKGHSRSFILFWSQDGA